MGVVSDVVKFLQEHYRDESTVKIASCGEKNPEEVISYKLPAQEGQKGPEQKEAPLKVKRYSQSRG